MNTPTERVLGIGGLFFRSHDPKKLAQWYQLNLGIDHRVWQQAAGPTAFTPFAMNTDYFGSEQQAWMVNFRVRSLDAMVAQLQKSNIEVNVDTEKSNLTIRLGIECLEAAARHRQQPVKTATKANPRA
jgi:glyoxylase I family protein